MAEREQQHLWVRTSEVLFLGWFRIAMSRFVSVQLYEFVLSGLRHPNSENPCQCRLKKGGRKS
jgi:hypothetical protein